MAYSVLLASLPDNEVVAFRERRSEQLRTSLSIRCSHLLPHVIYPKFRALRDVLHNAVDGGERLSPDLWHPLRVPTWHASGPAFEIEHNLRETWRKTLEEEGRSPDPNDWYQVEISQVLTVFAHAAAVHNGVVSFLCPPFDKERASRVLIPLDTESGCPQPVPLLQRLSARSRLRL